MIKILIVDDNKNNRMILNLLLEDYMEEHPEQQFEITETQNGKEAVQAANAEPFDLILMDIMMPEMDGIEATRLIREHDSNVMIIAVSAVDDSERQKKILSNGAEDYVSKPVNADIFQNRIANYLTIIESRKHRGHVTVHHNDDASNLFTQEIFSRELIFSITSDDTLSEFWEYYLLEEAVKYDDLSDVIRTIYALGDIQVKLGNKCKVIVEESDTDIFFTLTQIDKIGSQLIKLTLAKNSAVKEYKLGETSISFRLKKISTAEEEPLVPIEHPHVTNNEPVSTAPSPEAVEFTRSASEMRIYTYMDPEDLEELEDLMGSLSSLLLMVGSSEMSDEEVMSIASYLEGIAKIMTVYTETYGMATALQELSNEIESHVETFTRESAALGPMCGAFNNDIAKWLRMTFHEGSPSVDFMDDTIITNAKTISGMLKMDDAPSDDTGLDDIFDF